MFYQREEMRRERVIGSICCRLSERLKRKGGRWREIEMRKGKKKTLKDVVK